ncbi:MAG: glycosyl hydrolase [Balneolaceae bacterium]|nr:MAG: glycosyl hydrolase [Balneolaceae bacterium]
MKTLKFNIIAVLTACLAGLLTYTASAQFQQNPIVSPEIHENGSVTFRLMAQAADTVRISGNWMAGWGAAEIMTKNEDGLWEITLHGLVPDYYNYVYRVDGVRTTDPSNPWVIRDVRNTFSAFILPGEESRFLSLGNGKQGTIHEVWYPSPVLDMEQRRMKVYLPPGYHENGDSYPVLYLLHGGGGDEEAWTELGLANRILDNLIHSGETNPMIVVMTNGNPNQSSTWHVNPGHEAPRQTDSVNPMANIRFEESLVRDVIPFVESRYRVKTGKENRAVTGLSMGGWQTQQLALAYPEVFDYYGVMSMGLIRASQFGMDAEEHLERTRQNLRNLQETGYKLYWVACGTDDFLFDSVIHFREVLDELGFDYVYRETGGGHTWDIWRQYLSEFTPMIFR